MKTIHCKHCGAKLGIDSKCYGCGYTPFLMKSSNRWKVVCILIIGLVISYAIEENRLYVLETAQLEAQVESLQTELKEVKKTNFQMGADLMLYETKSAAVNNRFVFFTPTGSVYHKIDCHHLLNARNIRGIPLKNVRRSQQPCSVCHPN